jgi:hypothetical protein
MKAIWTEKEPEYSGEMVNLSKMMTWPKPVQKPHPPVIVGGGFPHAARRAIRYGDGWIPLGGRMDLPALVDEFYKMAAEAGRSREELPLTSFGVSLEGDSIAKSAEVGIDRVVISLPSEAADKTLPVLDRIAEAAGKYA